ncbi:unnamed protein product [Cylicocyclus nassatus]|uniref:Uncharacterized protein n=1 Tax=Cylicocyclus nassatus TaxID=53992 RepID=A0AA36MIL8_CYLNA|nr:unnamed protein product [Cylicocyclus nassatus]
MMLTNFFVIPLILVYRHATSAIIIPPHQFVAPRYVILGGNKGNVITPVWPRIIARTKLEANKEQRTADPLGIPAAYWVATFFLATVTIIGMFLLLLIVRRRHPKTSQQAAHNHVKIQP